MKLKEKFIVESYFCEPDVLQGKMNKYFNDGYYPKEIKLKPYQSVVEGFIIYELQG